MKEQEISLPDRRAKRLNRNFEKGQSVFRKENLFLLRTVENPVVIDFNNTLVNERRPWCLNPDAPEAVDIARTGGTVIVITTNTTDWDLRRKALEEFGVWSPDSILMTAKNYTPQKHHEIGRAKRAIKEFVWLNKLLKRDMSGRDFSPFFHLKRIAPIFMKPYDIPLLDDLPENTLNNPGMLGLRVRKWCMQGADESLPTLKQAAFIAAEYYQSLKK